MNDEKPLYEDFKRDVISLLRMQGFDITENYRGLRRMVEIFCRMPENPLFGEMSIRPILRRVMAEDVFELLLEISDAAIPKGAVIAYAGAHNSALLEEHEHYSRIKIIDFKDLRNAAIGMGRYLSALKEAWASDAGIFSSYNPSFHVKVGCNDEIGNLGSIDLLVREWLNESASPPVLVFGDIGSGKTWLCYDILRQQAELYQKEFESRVPIVLPLKECTPGKDLWSDLSDYLEKKYKAAPVGKANALQMLNTNGRLLLLLDGFDEACLEGTTKSVKQIFDKISEAIVPKSKVLVTCRKDSYDRIIPFLAQDEQYIIRSTGQKSSRWKKIFLKPLDNQEIKEYIQRRFRIASEIAKQYFEAIPPELKHLIQNPYNLSMLTILQTPDKLVAGMSKEEVCRVLLRSIIEGEYKRSPGPLLPFQKEQLLKKIAQHLLKNKGVDKENLAKIVKETFDKGAAWVGEMGEVWQDLLTGGILGMNRDEELEFKHKLMCDTARKLKTFSDS